MAAEALTDSMNKHREEKTQSTKPETTEKNTETTDKSKTEIDERYKRLLKKHGIPDSEEFLHKREQLYLLTAYKHSNAFIDRVIKLPSMTIDMLRMAAFAAGEDFLKNLVPGEEPDEEQIRGWLAEYMKSAVTHEQVKQANSSVEKSLDIMGRHMVRQQEIASAQITRLTEYIKQINEMDRDKNERDMHEMRAEHQKEREAAQKQIELLSDENFRLNMKIEETQEEAQRQAEEKKREATAPVASGTDPVSKQQGREESIFAYRRRMKEKKRREEFIASVLGNGNFSKEQLAVIERVVRKNFTLPQLQKICDPQVKPENMELLEAYYERRQLHG